jgi:predicted metal-dependent hydrolase
MRFPETQRVSLPAPRDALAPAMDFLVRWNPSTRARRVSLRICLREGAVIITLPPGATRREGIALLKAHGAWAMEHLAALAPALPFLPGSIVPIGDVAHRLRHAPRLRTPPFLDGRDLVVTGALRHLATRTTGFLRDEAKRRVTARLPAHTAQLGVVPRRIRIKDMRSRWGSCAPDGTLGFSWRLVMAPGWVLDYVVAHEVAHLRELNHSPRFWAHVARLSPDRDAAVDWLRRHGPRLLRIG